ncbi:hypothetical protein BG53_02515 [Paenibacillus darwinianus]|uniref:Uncharacterized protein n=1 Tax=Paenibacillus darwinianus TaxID=1380763 RepID=A0A9W5W6Z7_9BACL|nr:hypothetical protein [Paenibacillus darwinianus]EXX84893.1 hypothetical protein BG52_09710 [Paenibacillus darwinianus]EXX88127.1 hypothetical protein BG53_02515 [Paenibacillus darwinianus]EXX89057.1 hypothetical protein CH50_02335 [Paenibacillus darwinianus]
MALSNCTKCGQVMLNSRSMFCAECTSNYSEDIDKVKHYIMTHPKPSLMEACQKTDIPVNTLQQFIKDGIISRLN